MPPTHSVPERDNPLKRLGFLVGEWIGRGQGDTFTYREEASFQWVLDERALAYRSHSTTDEGVFVHCEEGYLMYADREERLLGMFVYGDGLMELAEVTFEADGGITLDTQQLIAVPRGKSYRAIRRRLTPTPEGFRHEIELNLGAEGPFHHAKSDFRRADHPGNIANGDR